jgi:hypothetical protein
VLGSSFYKLKEMLSATYLMHHPYMKYFRLSLLMKGKRYTNNEKNTDNPRYCHVLSDCRRGLDCQLDLLDLNTVTVYTQLNTIDRRP